MSSLVGRSADSKGYVWPDCQVEQKRLGIPTSVPVAVQQWEGGKRQTCCPQTAQIPKMFCHQQLFAAGLIAVNYAARAAGITRHMRVGEARQKCPELRTVHVETIGQ